MPGQLKPVCPHLGLPHDAASHMNFPSIVNQCWNCKIPTPPSLAHQRDFCLSHSHGDCVLNQTSQRISMPPEMSAFPSGPKRIGWIATALILFLGITVIFLSRTSLPSLDFFNAGEPQIDPAGFSVSTADPLASSINTAMTGTFTSAPTDSSTPAALPSETPVFIEVKHIYEATKLPPGTSHALLVHIVAQGETLDLIASQYGTTVQAIMSVNYGLTPPAWVDYPIVIPVDTLDASGLPAFKVYVVKDYETITAQALAEILAVDVKDLEFYNLCSGNCQFKKGDVLLIPHNP